MQRLSSYLTVLLLLACAVTSTAQERVWNAALDRYEFICRRCADWRGRVNEGKAVPRDSLKALTMELSALKQNLQYALGDMTTGQRRRFEAIRDWFTTGSWPEYSMEPISLCRFAPTGRPRPPRGWIMEPCPPLSLSESYPFKEHRPGEHPPRVPIRISRFAGVSIGFYPDLSLGILAGAEIKRFGIFVKGRSNFRLQSTGYDCLSDGTLSGGFFWSGGEKCVQRHQLTLDLSYAVFRPVSVYVGGGYGERKLCWKDSVGQWARVSDRSFRGVALDAGLLIRPVREGAARRLTLLLGCSWMPASSPKQGYLDLEAGVAWRWGLDLIR